MVQTFARYTRDESEMKIQCEDMIEENMLSQLILKQLLHLLEKQCLPYLLIITCLKVTYFCKTQRREAVLKIVLQYLTSRQIEGVVLSTVWNIHPALLTEKWFFQSGKSALQSSWRPYRRLCNRWLFRCVHSFTLCIFWTLKGFKDDLRIGTCKIGFFTEDEKYLFHNYRLGVWVCMHRVSYF